MYACECIGAITTPEMTPPEADPTPRQTTPRPLVLDCPREIETPGCLVIKRALEVKSKVICSPPSRECCRTAEPGSGPVDAPALGPRLFVPGRWKWAWGLVGFAQI